MNRPRHSPGHRLALAAVAALYAATVVAPTSAHAQSSVNGRVALETVGQLGGPSLAVATHGSLALFGVGPTVWVLDYAASNRGGSIGHTRHLGGTVQDIVAMEDVAYVAVDQGGLALLDIADPRNPRVLGQLDTPGRALGLAVRGAGDVAYVADEGALRIIDVADRARPLELGSVPIPSGCCAENVAVSGTAAFVAAGEAGLVVVDVDTAARPRLLATLDTPGVARNLLIDRQTLYLNAFDAGLRVVDITNPARPREVGAADERLSGQGMFRLGRWVFVADETDGIRVFDVSSPQHPRHMIAVGGELGNDGQPYSGATDLVVYEYLGGGMHPSAVASRFVANRPDLTGLTTNSVAYWTGVFGNDVAVQGGLAVGAGREPLRRDVRDNPGAAWIVDVTQPSTPRLRSFAAAPAERTFGYAVTARQAAIAGDRLWLTHAPVPVDRPVAEGGVTVFDVRDPGAPVRLATASLDRLDLDPLGLAILGGRALVPSMARAGVARLGLFDAVGSDILREINPTVSPAATLGGAVLAHGDRLYAVVNPEPDTPGRQIAVLDATDPERLDLLGRVDLPQPARLLALAADRLYVTAGPPGDGGAGTLHVLDVADARAPREIGRANVLRGPSGVAVMDGVAYVASTSSGVVVVDVEDPSRPRVLGTHPVFGPAGGVTAAGGYVYVSAANHSFSVIQARLSAPPSATAHPTATADPTSATPTSPPSPTPAASPEPSPTGAIDHRPGRWAACLPWVRVER